MKCKKCNINNIEHRYLCLCSNCYREKRKNDWKINEQKRIEKDKDRIKKKKIYNKKYYEANKTLVNKKCVDCGQSALKGSRYSQCRLCSNKRMAKNKVIYQINRKKTHLPTKIRNKLSSRLKDFLKTHNKDKSKSIVDFLGCTIEEFIVYIESKFQPGMTWDNYGLKGWHFDHIKPVSAFDPNDENDLNKMSHYTNLQPLWAKDNLSKGNRYEE